MTVIFSTMSMGLSIDKAALVTELSKRTWQRRLADGSASRLPDDLRGRSMVSLNDVRPLICIPMEEEDLLTLIEADAGSAAAQSDIGQLFAVAGKHEISIQWLQQAAKLGDADAMQWLGIAYASGKGTAKNENLATMWIAKSAALGHIIASQQIRYLINSP